MNTTFATDRHGNRLLSVEAATHEELVAAAAHTPCPLALAVLVDSATQRVLFGMNTWRREYELPGGIVDPGESFFEAARRELEEETSIRVDTLGLLGYARFALTAPIRDELGAIYFAEVTDQQATPSDEMQQFVWRKPLSQSDLAVAALDDVIAEWAVRFSAATGDLVEDNQFR